MATKTKAKTFICPVCKTRYSVQSMANNCTKTTTCKFYNRPSGERLELYFVQQKVATTMLFLIIPMLEQLENPDPILRKLEAEAEEIFKGLHNLLINPVIGEEAEHKCLRMLFSLWERGSYVPTAEGIEIIKYLALDILENADEFWQKHGTMSLQSEWMAVFELCDTYLKTCDYEFDSNMREKELALRHFIWPAPEASKKEPHLFLVNDRFWVVGYTRQEIRDVIRKEFGLTRITMESIPANEKLADGSSASDLVALASHVPMLVGRTE